MKKNNKLGYSILTLVMLIVSFASLTDLSSLTAQVPVLQEVISTVSQYVELPAELPFDLPTQQANTPSATNIDEIPPYTGAPYVVINQNIPSFDNEKLPTHSYEDFGKLDTLKRCVSVEANIGRDLMPTADRKSISHIKPTGWHSVRYDNVDGKSLYNRCHLIGFQLTGENDNDRNLITGTRYLNVEGMLPFEDMVADYVKETGNHVFYRVTPIFEGNNLIASGVQMEGKSVEDNGEGIMYNVYCYNVQPDIAINYQTGKSEYKKGADRLSTSGIPAQTTSQITLTDNKSSFLIGIITLIIALFTGKRTFSKKENKKGK